MNHSVKKAFTHGMKKRFEIRLTLTSQLHSSDPRGEDFKEVVKKLGSPILHGISSYLPNNNFVNNHNHEDKLCLQLPIGRKNKFRGFIDLVEVEACEFLEKGKVSAGKVPSKMDDCVAKKRTELIVKLAEEDDKILEKFGFDKPVSAAEIKEAIARVRFVPTFMCTEPNTTGNLHLVSFTGSGPLMAVGYKLQEIQLTYLCVFKDVMIEKNGDLIKNIKTRWTTKLSPWIVFAVECEAFTDF